MGTIKSFLTQAVDSLEVYIALEGADPLLQEISLFLTLIFFC